MTAISLQTATVFGQGTAFSYTGKLSDNSAPANGLYDFRFALFDSTNTPANLIVGPITNRAIMVNGGLFTTTLDFGPGVFAGANYWLEVGVRTNGGSTFTALVPRQPILPTPYAVMANSASNLLGNLPAAQLNSAISIRAGTNLIDNAAGNFTANGSNAVAAIVQAAIANAGAVTNGQNSVNLTGNFHTPFGGQGNTPPAYHFAIGDSLNCVIVSNGWYSYGGYSNSYATTCTNGLIYYFTATNANGQNSWTYSIWQVLTNQIYASKGWVVNLDTATAVPGSTVGSIAYGYKAWECNYVNQDYTASGTSPRAYGSNGQTNFATGVPTSVPGWECCYVPRSTNDLGVIVNGVTYSNVIVGNYYKITNCYGAAPYDRLTQATMLGTPGSNVTALIYTPWFPQGQYFPPYEWAGASTFTTNFSSHKPLYRLFTNSPMITGVSASASLLAGGNDLSFGFICGSGGWNLNPVASNNFAATVYLRSWLIVSNLSAWGYNPILFLTWPRNYATPNGSGQDAANLNTYNRLILGTKLPNVYPVDLDAFVFGTNGGFTLNSSNYLCGTGNGSPGVHPANSMAIAEGLFIFTNIGLPYLSRNPATSSDPLVTLVTSPTNVYGSTGSGQYFLTNCPWNFTLGPGTYSYQFSFFATNATPANGAVLYLDVRPGDVARGFYERGDLWSSPGRCSPVPDGIHLAQLYTTGTYGGYSTGWGMLTVTATNVYRPEFENIGGSTAPCLMTNSYILFRKIQ